MFKDDGRHLGQVHMPARCFIRDDPVYGVIRDDVDAQYVVASGWCGDTRA
jgi:hypothetical protein